MADAIRRNRCNVAEKSASLDPCSVRLHISFGNIGASLTPALCERACRLPIIGGEWPEAYDLTKNDPMVYFFDAQPFDAKDGLLGRKLPNGTCLMLITVSC